MVKVRPLKNDKEKKNNEVQQNDYNIKSNVLVRYTTIANIMHNILYMYAEMRDDIREYRYVKFLRVCVAFLLNLMS